MFAQATCYASKIDFSCSYNKNARIENGQSTERSSTLEELLSENIAELPEIVEALQSQTNAGAAIELSMNGFSQKDIMRGRGKSLNRYVYCINEFRESDRPQRKGVGSYNGGGSCRRGGQRDSGKYCR